MPEKREDDYGEIREDELIKKLVPDPNNPDVKRVTGFVMGKSSRPGYWRLYLSVDLNHHLEFRQSDTVHAAKIREGRTVVWLKPDAKITETRTASGSQDFVEGGLIQQYLRRRGADVAGLLGFRDTRVMAADGSGCAHTGCSAGCTPGYGCGGGSDTIGYTCGC
jgi:hypothetical protein